MAKEYCANCGDAVDGLVVCANCGDKVWVASPQAVADAVNESPPWHWFKLSLKLFFKNYSVFKGRSGPQEFAGPWVMMFFFNQLLTLLTFGESFETGGVLFLVIFVFQMLVYALVALPAMAVMSRRLHDTGRTAHFIWLILVPILGWIALLVLMCLKSEPRDNKYGPYKA